MIYTYILRSLKDGKWYTGVSADFRKRLKEHNSNQVQSTKSRGPFDVIYYEACHEEGDAFAREKFLKSGLGKRYLKTRLKRFLSRTGQARGGVYPAQWLWCRLVRSRFSSIVRQAPKQ